MQKEEKNPNEEAKNTSGWLPAGENGELPENPAPGDENVVQPTDDNEAIGAEEAELSPEERAELPTDEYSVASRQHPTGFPDQTGGWYTEGELDSAKDAADSSGQDADVSARSKPILVIPPHDKEAEIPTQPVKVRPPDTQPEPVQTIPVLRPPSEPLPQRVDEVDVNATRVTPAAYGGAPVQPVQSLPDRQPPPSRVYPQPQTPAAGLPRNYPPPPTRPPAAQTRRRARPKSSGSATNYWGCLLRLMVAGLFLAALLVVVVGVFGVYKYFSIASTLPSVDDLRNRASQFETTRILDRNGNVLYEILDPNAGRRTYVPLNRMSPYLIAATIATEDKEFWNHPGFDLVAISRALWNNYRTSGEGGGASTITQQLARTLLLSPQERAERTVQRKAREIILAAEITRRYSKEDILELYLNENFYGNFAYGVEAAAETYFNTSAEALTLSQASFLAGLPQAPAVYDIFQNRDATLARHRQVLTLMYVVTRDNDCIDVGAQAQPVCVDAPTAQAAAKEIEEYPFAQRQNTIRYPHWVFYIRQLLEAQFDAQTIYRSGFTVFTTLEPTLQDQAQAIVKSQVDGLADRNVTDGALVALRPPSGEILAMVGSADFYNKAISGQVNMAISPRQPGSSFKPITYLAAFEKGWTPSTLIWDVYSEFPPSGDPNDPRAPYIPENYDGRYHGPVTVRSALANSFNVPAVKALQFVGIYDDPNTSGADGLINFARRLGISTLTRPDYGLALTLGGGDVTVLEMTSAFGVFANSGMRMPPVAITKITDYTGNTVYEYQPPQAEQVIRPEHAYLISSILSDNEARTPMFGGNSVLNLPFQAAAKTGTTNDFRDNWTLGYTPDLAVGVWVGNADYTPMVNTTGLTGAAPIWSQFMQFAVPTITGGNPSPFVRPPGIVDKVICSISGTEPSEFCPEQRSEVFAFDQLPQPKENDLWQKIKVDTWTGLKASAACSDFADEKFSLNVTEKWGVRWVRDTDEGRSWAASMGFEDPVFFTPERECKLEDSRPTIVFSGLENDQAITSVPLDIYAVIFADQDFRDWRLQWGVGADPVEWNTLVQNSPDQYRTPVKIHSWDLADVPPGKRVTLRLYMRSTRDTYAERKLVLRNMVPTVTPSPSPTATETSIPTSTPTLMPSETPAPTQTLTPEPSLTPTTNSLFPWPLPWPFPQPTATP